MQTAAACSQATKATNYASDSLAIYAISVERDESDGDDDES